MENRHIQMYINLLQRIESYSQRILERLNFGSGDLPQWTNDLISEARTHIADVTHFIRGQSNDGIRYGQADHGRAYMAAANLRQIYSYSKECLSLMSSGAGNLPAWAENKISVTAKYMDLIGHWLENENTEGRQYGRNPLPGNAGSEAVYRGRADGLIGRHRNPFSPNDFRRKAYESGYSETGRRFGVPGFAPGQPGWAGAGGVAQIPYPKRGMRRLSSSGPGVETYGSLGYGSMGDGSMDMAVRGSRSYSGNGEFDEFDTRRRKVRRNKSRKRRRILRGK